MVTVMSEPQNRQSKPRGRKGVAISAYIPQRIKDLMELLGERNHRTFTGELIVALEEHLRQNGLLPQLPPLTPDQSEAD